MADINGLLVDVVVQWWLVREVGVAPATLYVGGRCLMWCGAEPDARQSRKAQLNNGVDLQVFERCMMRLRNPQKAVHVTVRCNNIERRIYIQWIGLGVRRRAFVSETGEHKHISMRHLCTAVSQDEK